MRPSPLSHPVAVLRKVLGLGQTEFGKIVEKSARTIQSIELNSHDLTEELAQTISQETGVAYAWLMGGDPEIKPWAEGPVKVPYLREHYERTRHWRSRQKIPSFSEIVGDEAARKALGNNSYEERRSILDAEARGWSDDLLRDIGRLLAAIRAAESAGRSDIARYRIAAFADTMIDDFGQAVDEEFLNRYTTLLRKCRASVRATKTVLAKTGPTLQSPHIPQKGWVGSEGATAALLWVLTRMDSNLSDKNILGYIERVSDEAATKSKVTTARKKRTKSRRV